MNEKHSRKTRRIRRKIKNKSSLPRLSVFRSNRWIYAQVIDARSGRVLAAASSKSLSPLIKPGTAAAQKIGEVIASSSIKAGAKKVVFDRGCYSYHGQVKALAEAAREHGLIF